MNKIALPGQFLYMTLQMKLSRSGGASKKLDYFDVLAPVVRGLGCVISGRSRVWLEECMNWAKEDGGLFRIVAFDMADGEVCTEGTQELSEQAKAAADK